MERERNCEQEWKRNPTREWENKRERVGERACANARPSGREEGRDKLSEGNREREESDSESERRRH